MIGCEMAGAPADFKLTYKMNMGTAPPRDYYEYTLRVASGGKAEFLFAPEAGRPPAWTESFAVQRPALEQLYRRMIEAGVWMRDWRSRRELPQGGIWRELEAVADGKRAAVPAWPEDPGRIDEIYSAIRALVPAGIWNKVRAVRPRDWEGQPISGRRDRE